MSCIYIYSNGPKVRICFWKRNKSTRRLRFSVAEGIFFLFFWLIVTICRVYATKWFFWNFTSTFLDDIKIVGIKGETRKLRIWGTCFGRCCCCFVFSVNFRYHARCSPFLLNKSSMVQEIFILAGKRQWKCWFLRNVFGNAWNEYFNQY